MSLVFLCTLNILHNYFCKYRVSFTTVSLRFLGRRDKDNNPYRFKEIQAQTITNFKNIYVPELREYWLFIYFFNAFDHKNLKSFMKKN